MNTFLFLVWSLVAMLLAPFRAMFKIAKPMTTKFGHAWRVIGLGMGRKAVVGVSLGRFQTCDSVSNNNVPSAQAYTFQAPAGTPGDVTRVDESNVEPAMLVAISSVYAQSFGIAMVYNGDGISQVGAAFAAADFAGVLARQAPSISDSGGDSLAGAVPLSVQVQGLLVRGYINVLCVYGTPIRGGVVYVRTVSTVNNTQLGTFDATADSTNNVALSLTQASWASSGKDANNNAELRVAR